MEKKTMMLSWLLEAWEYCMGDKGGEGCTGCPNAIPGTEDKDGLCECRINLKRATVDALRALTEERKA